MDATEKIGIKVARMKAANSGERYMGIPTVTMPRIKELQEKARREGKTLADVYKEEEITAKPSPMVGTVKEVKAAIEAKKAAKEKKDLPEAPVEPVVEPTKVVEPAKVDEVLVEAIVDEIVDDATEEDIPVAIEPVEPIEETPGLTPREEFVEKASLRTIKDLRDFARTAGIPLSSVRKDDLVEELANDILKEQNDYGIFYEFFMAEAEE